MGKGEKGKKKAPEEKEGKKKRSREPRLRSSGYRTLLINISIAAGDVKRGDIMGKSKGKGKRDASLGLSLLLSREEITARKK